MNKNDLKERTKSFGLRCVNLTNALPKTAAGHVLGNQLLRAGTSVGANYRSACRSRSTAEFIAKIGVVEEEADECCYWLEIVRDAKLMKAALLQSLLQEADELTAIMAASRKSAARNRRR
ncbi:MAG: four helix bundle protein [Verrucomicrobiota bacterium]